VNRDDGATGRHALDRARADGAGDGRRAEQDARVVVGVLAGVVAVGLGLDGHALARLAVERHGAVDDAPRPQRRVTRGGGRGELGEAAGVQRDDQAPLGIDLRLETPGVVGPRLAPVVADWQRLVRGGRAVADEQGIPGPHDEHARPRGGLTVGPAHAAFEPAVGFRRNSSVACSSSAPTSRDSDAA
jgi:hypothetical protein